MRTKILHAKNNTPRPCFANSGVSLCLMLFLMGGFCPAESGDPAPWWNIHWRMRVSLEIDVGPYERFDKPVEYFLNFKTLLAGIGRGGEVVLPESLIPVIAIVSVRYATSAPFG